MSSLIIIDSNIKDLDILKKSIKKEHRIIINKDFSLTNEEVYENFNEEINYITFIYHFQGYYQIPFFNNQEYKQFSYFSDNLVNLLKNIREKTNDLTLDLLTCDINNIYFSSEVKEIEKYLNIKIRFSINKTGNINGDWILESDNTNIKNFYFTDDIINWKYSLAGGMTTDYLVTNFSDYFSKNGLVTKLKQNATNLQIGISNNSTDYIILNNGEIFDGQNFTINFGSNAIQGVFRMPNVKEASNMPTIENLTINLTTGTVGPSTAGGGIIGNNQQFFRIKNCKLISSSSGSIRTDSGGICGTYAGLIVSNIPGEAIIEDCYTTCSISGSNSGGICGKYGGYYGKITIKNCYSTGIINGNNAGGICGQNFGIASTNSIVEGCYSIGDINGTNAGGIIGTQGANHALSNIIINKSYSTGTIIGLEAGGICGSDCANLGKIKISECFSLGNINGNKAGGISGSECGNSVDNNNNLLEIINCYSNGNLTGTYSGGILGYNCGDNYGRFKVSNCYSVGIATSLQAGGIIGYNNDLIGKPSICIVENCYCANSNLSFDNSKLDITNSETNLTKIQNKIDQSTTFNTTTIWKVPSSNIISLNKYPRLLIFCDPDSIYYKEKYLTYDYKLDYKITNTNQLNFDVNYYKDMSDTQIYNLRSLIITDIFNNNSSLNNLICSRQGLGFNNQTNSNSFSKINYIVLKANNTTSYNLASYITSTNGVYVNLVNATDFVKVTLLSGVQQIITKNSNSTYTFEAAP